MALRLRIVNGRLVAFCAVETDEKPGDVYLDDGTHEALAAKFLRDFHKSGLIPGSAPSPLDPEANAERVRDEDDEMRRWTAERDELVRRVLLYIPRELALDFTMFFGLPTPAIGKHAWPKVLLNFGPKCSTLTNRRSEARSRRVGSAA